MNSIHTIVGELALLAIFLLAVWGIYSPRVRDGLLGRFLYIVEAIACLAGFSHMAHENVPRIVLVTILVCVALHMLRDIVIAHYRDPVLDWLTRQRR